MKRLKIALLHWGFPPIIGSVETHLSLLGPELIKRGHSVSLLTGSVNGCKVDYAYKGMRIKRSPLFDLDWLFKRGLDGLEDGIENLITMFLDASKPDIIHSHNMHYFSKIHAELLDNCAKKHKIPLLLTAHNIWDECDFLDFTLDTGWKHIIAVSEYIKFELMGIGVSERKITVVHHGVDIDKFKKSAIKDIFKKYPIFRNRKIIFSPSRLSLAKGCDVSLKALRIIKKVFPDVLLIFTGTKNIIEWGTKQQKDIAYILHLAKKLGLEKNIFMQTIPFDLMPKFYRIADVCVYPSASQKPFGMSILESLASSVPVVVTESGGIEEVIKDGKNGFVVKIRNYKELADRCILILKNRKICDELGGNGRVLVEKKFTKEIMAENTIKVYNKILA